MSHLSSLFSRSLFSSLSIPQQRAEHNEGILHSLEELSLNQLGLVNLGFVGSAGEAKEEEQQQTSSLLRRSLLPRACRRLRHLSLAGNSLPRLPCGPRDLGLCKELKTLNVALNAIESIKRRGEEAKEDEGPLSSCESLRRLDLSGNFISKRTIRESVDSLRSAPVLENLWLSGCPVAVGWTSGYRSFVVGSLPKLKELVRGRRREKRERERVFCVFPSFLSRKQKKCSLLIKQKRRMASPSPPSSASRPWRGSRS